jgi:hypothetical protein
MTMGTAQLAWVGSVWGNKKTPQRNNTQQSQTLTRI